MDRIKFSIELNLGKVLRKQPYDLQQYNSQSFKTRGRRIPKLETPIPTLFPHCM
jgi:hypothetical protein